MSVGIGQRLGCTIILTREDGGGGNASVGLYGNELFVGSEGKRDQCVRPDAGSTAGGIFYLQLFSICSKG